jgi:hemerythrin-like metal-binding protein
MGIPWTLQLALGIDAIDAQHQELFGRANRLLAAMESRRGSQEVSTLLHFLETYTEEHFRAEEASMGRAGYPGLAAHHALHGEFEAELSALRTAHDQGSSLSLLAIRANGLLCDWLLLHVSVEDRKFAGWLSETARRAG